MTDDNSTCKLNVSGKKKRGRKPKSYYAELEKQGILPNILKDNIPKEKKKRGRKPLLKKKEEKKEPKKRGRKPKKRNFNIVEFEKVKFDEEDEDVILHIPIKIKKTESVNKNLIIPSPYEEENLYHNINNKEFNNNYLNNQYNNIIKNDNNYNNKVNQILIPFKNSNKNGIWPERVNIYCWHCCHPFKESPVSIPMYIKNNKFYVYGAFCSYNCGAAYNLNSNDYNKTTKHELLCHMYSKLFKDKNFIDINPAPPKEILQIFGGNVTIDEYRNNFLTNNKEFKILKPPLVSIIPQVEVTIKHEKKNNNKFIPFNEDILKKDSVLNLKRDKPISNKNTLEKCMGIKSYCN